MLHLQFAVDPLGDHHGHALPRVVNLTHLDSGIDYQPGTQSDRRITGSGESVRNVSVPFSMTAAEGQKLANRLLWTAWSQRKRFKLTLPPSYARLVPNDVIRATINNETYPLRITKIDHGYNHLIVVEGYVETVVTLESTGVAAARSQAAQLYVPPLLDLLWLDLPPLSDEHDTRIGYYYAAAAHDPDATWQGGSLNVSLEEAGTYELEAALDDEIVLGVASTALADTNARAAVWDNANTVRVALTHGTLSSKTEAEVLNGANLALLGNEIIAFQTATLVSTRVYDLSNLLRGRRDTEDHMGSHTTNEQFVMLNDPLLSFVAPGSENLNRNRYYKAAAKQQDLAGVNPELHKITGESVKPFRPAHVTGSRDGSNNLTIEWVRVSRRPFRLLGGGSTPLLENRERYDVEIMSGATVKRTIRVNGSTSTIYSAADQTTDGFTPGNAITVRIYQIGDTVGRGNMAEATV